MSFGNDEEEKHGLQSRASEELTLRIDEFGIDSYQLTQRNTSRLKIKKVNSQTNVYHWPVYNLQGNHS